MSHSRKDGMSAVRTTVYLDIQNPTPNLPAQRHGIRFLGRYNQRHVNPGLMSTKKVEVSKMKEALYQEQSEENKIKRT